MQRLTDSVTKCDQFSLRMKEGVPKLSRNYTILVEVGPLGHRCDTHADTSTAKRGSTLTFRVPKQPFYWVERPHPHLARILRVRY